jgi:predicted nucleic acid-binding protein
MKRWLLDSSALLILLRCEAGHQRVLEVIDDAELILVASLSIAEVSRRALALGASTLEIAEMIGLCKALTSKFITIDVAIAERSLLLSSASNKRLPLVDSLIAACAAQEDATLLHRDQHFENIPAHLLKQECLPGSLS